MTDTSENVNYISVDYEVYGRVQGVFFRKYTSDKAREVGVGGWVMNTASGTVKGTFQGSVQKVNEMKYFVSKVGSPMSTINRAVFSNEKKIDKLDYTNFAVRESW